MRHIVIQDRNGIFSINVNRIASSYYANNGTTFKIMATNPNTNRIEPLEFRYETAEEAFEAYEKFLSIIKGE